MSYNSFMVVYLLPYHTFWCPYTERPQAKIFVQNSFVQTKSKNPYQSPLHKTLNIVYLSGAAKVQAGLQIK